MSLQKNRELHKYSADESIKIDLGKNSNIEYIPNFINDKESKKYLDELKSLNEWMHGTYSMFGKDIKTPRLLWSMRDKKYELPDGYSVTGSSVYTPLINKLRKKVEKYTKCKLLYAQLNYYRDGKDYIGWHTDSEVEDGDIIASISLGETRKFSLKNRDYKKTNNEIKYDLMLKNGSLLIMDSNAAKKHWKHTLPKMKTDNIRINLTFRNK